MLDRETARERLLEKQQREARSRARKEAAVDEGSADWTLDAAALEVWEREYLAGLEVE